MEITHLRCWLQICSFDLKKCQCILYTHALVLILLPFSFKNVRAGPNSTCFKKIGPLSSLVWEAMGGGSKLIYYAHEQGDEMNTDVLKLLRSLSV